MEFRTSLLPTNQTSSIKLGDSFITIGSCFANSIDQKLRKNKFHSLNNPLGILFDPASIARVLTYAMDGTRPEEKSYYSINNLIVNLEAHSDMNGKTINEVAQSIDSKLSILGNELKKANWLILTFGTSWMYTHKKRELSVANCHKIPQKEFTKSLLPNEVTKQVYDELIEKLQVFNPELQIIVTVSPVRHLKDTLPLNNLSKSHLLILSHHLADKYQQVQYYPSYELVMDDLRDYRFYKSDMLHPTDQTIDYVWEHFTQNYFTKKALDFLKEWNSIRKALQHRPFNPDSQQHQKFVKSTLDRLKKINSIIDVKAEIAEVQSQLI